MYSRLLDVGMFARVVSAAPDVTHPPASDARLILLALRKLSLEAPVQMGMDGRPYWACLLGELPGLPEGMTGKRAGMLCREMGLVMHRRNIGYEVAWTGEQLRLLLEFFRIEDV